MNRRALSMPLALAAVLSGAGPAAARGPHPPSPSVLMAEPLRATPSSTNRLSLREALVYAVQTDARLNEMAVQTHRLAGAASAIRPASPEIRVTGEQGRGDRRFESSEMQSSLSSRTGSERLSQSAAQFSADRRLSQTDAGDPLEPDRSETEESRGADLSRASGSGSGQSHLSGTGSTTTTGHLDEDQEAMSIELRLRLPNPWELRSARGAARAAWTMSEAELSLRESWLACDVTEAAARLHFTRRAQELRRDLLRRLQAGQDRLQRAFLQGALQAADYADACRFFASAVADEQRVAARAIELEQEWRRLTGLEPGHVDFGGLERAPICPVAPAADPAEDHRWADRMTPAHPALLLAQWNLRRCEAERSEARARNIPWVSYLAGGYGWRESSGTGFESFQGSGVETRTESSSSTERELEISGSRSTEQETPTGDQTTNARGGTQYTTSQSFRTGTSREQSTTSGSETSRRDDDSAEWWVVVGVDVPIFEWMSREGRDRVRTLGAAREASERLAMRIHRDLLGALAFARQSRLAEAQARERLDRGTESLSHLPDSARLQNTKTELENLRIEATRVELAALRLDAALQELLSRTELVRAAGQIPALDPAP